MFVLFDQLGVNGGAAWFSGAQLARGEHVDCGGRVMLFAVDPSRVFSVNYKKFAVHHFFLGASAAGSPVGTTQHVSNPPPKKCI